MSATEEWLRYIESKAIRQVYNINGYIDQNGNTSSEQSGTDSTDQNV